MDLNELWLIVIGAVLGFLLSIGTFVIERIIDRKGKLRIFYKIVYQKETSKTAGFSENGSESYLTIPMYLELQNTSNTTRVLRDVCLYLFFQGTEIGKMNQIQYSKHQKKSGNTVTGESINYFGGDKGSYSFVLPPRSIQKYECEFAYKVNTYQKEQFIFDEIRFRYFDECNNRKECHFCGIENCWKQTEFNYENEYFELKCLKSKKRGDNNVDTN